MHTKVHAVVDGRGYSIYLQLSGGNAYDLIFATDILFCVELKGFIVLADKAYGLKENKRLYDTESCFLYYFGKIE